MAVIFKENLIEDDVRYAHLQNLFADNKERVREQERYSSKDSLIINNPPFESRKLETEFLFENIKNFCKNFLNYDIVESNLKPYHVLPTKRVLSGNLMPPVILKFVQFQVKDKVYKLGRLIKVDSKINHYPANHLIVKLIYINERLLPDKSMIKFATEDMSFVTST